MSDLVVESQPSGSKPKKGSANENSVTQLSYKTTRRPDSKANRRRSKHHRTKPPPLSHTTTKYNKPLHSQNTPTTLQQQHPHNRNHGCPRSFRELQRVSCPCPAPPTEVFTKKLRNILTAISHRVGVFSTLTNSYALVAVGASENFYRYVKREHRACALEQMHQHNLHPTSHQLSQLTHPSTASSKPNSKA